MLLSVVPKGIRLSIKDKVEMEVIEDSVVLKPVKVLPREGWKEAFCKMHERAEDVLHEVPASENFDWKW